MTNAGGFVTHSATFEPYGGNLEETGTGSSLGFTGEMHDSTGLVYLRARYADPVTGTFLTRDPVIGVSGFSQTWNPYSYVRNNPINLTDPSGRLAPLLMALLIVAAGAAIGAAVDVSNQQAEGRGECIDWVRVLKAAIVGGVAGGVAALAAGGVMLAAASLSAGKLVTLGAAVSWANGLTWAPYAGLSALASIAGGQAYRIVEKGFKGEFTVDSWFNGTLGNGLGRGDDMLVDAAFGVGGAFAERGIGALWRGAKGLWNRWRGKSGSPAGAAAGALDVCPANSFSADTLVLTDEGLKPIFEVEVGDEVIAYVEATGETGEYTVIDTIHHTDPEIVLLTIDDEVLETTAEHPFYTDDGVWVNAAELEVGEQVYSFSGDYGTVESVEVVTISQEMYNLTVAEAHTFFVGESSWLVHNVDPNVPIPFQDNPARWTGFLDELSTIMNRYSMPPGQLIVQGSSVPGHPGVFRPVGSELAANHVDGASDVDFLLIADDFDTFAQQRIAGARLAKTGGGWLKNVLDNARKGWFKPALLGMVDGMPMSGAIDNLAAAYSDVINGIDYTVVRPGHTYHQSAQREGYIGPLDCWK